MIYGVSNSAQFTPLVWSVLMGLCSGILWDILRFFRVIFPPGRIRLFFEDVFFFVAWAIGVFFLCYATNYGNIRTYILLAQPFGFFAWYCLPGRLTLRFGQFVRQWVCKCILLPLFHVYCKICFVEDKRKRAKAEKTEAMRKNKKKRGKNVLKMQKKTCKQKKDIV